jgi:hypothetical protein
VRRGDIAVNLPVHSNGIAGCFDGSSGVNDVSSTECSNW